VAQQKYSRLKNRLAEIRQKQTWRI